MKRINKKGFTLIELLAVIVILGVSMAIAIPSMTGYIANSRKDTMLSTAQQFIDSARTMLISENALPSYREAVIVPTSIIELDKGGVSPYTNKAFMNTVSVNDSTDSSVKSYVIVYNNAPTAAEISSKSYSYAITLIDEKGNCLEPVDETFLTTATTRQKRDMIKGSGCSITEVIKGGVEVDFTVNTLTGSSPADKEYDTNKITLYR